MLETSDALLAVDVQRDFLPGGALAVPHGDDVVPVIAGCIRKFMESGLPVYASRDWHPVNHCSFEENGGPWPSHCIADTAGAEIDPGLPLSENTTIIDKATTPGKDAYSAFDGTDLHDQLQRAGVRRLFVGGLATDYCVVSSARDALKCGYDVVLMTDAIRAIDDADGAAAIEELRRMGATIADSAAATED